MLSEYSAGNERAVYIMYKYQASSERKISSRYLTEVDSFSKMTCASCVSWCFFFIIARNWTLELRILSDLS